MSYNLEQVFGISRTVPCNYTCREEIDDLFLESIKRQKHIIIFGSSKQGKTCLRKKNLKDSEYITIVCTDKQDVGELNQKILKQAGFDITVSEKKTYNGKASTGGEGGIKFLASIKIKANIEGGFEKSIETKPFNIDLGDVNDIIKALQSIGFEKIILLEDFHYLNPDTQKDFANSLKAYYDNSNLKFIISGVWLDENKLVTLNGDLASRMVSINVDKWNFDNLKLVVEEGANLLNVRFDEVLIDDIIHESFDNVAFVQEMCYRICKLYKIQKTLAPSDPSIIERGYYDRNEDYIEGSVGPENKFLIKEVDAFKELAKNIVEQHSGRYNTFLVQFADLNRDSELQIPKWITFCLLNFKIQNLQEGLTVNQILKEIKTHHPKKDRINEKEIIEILKSIISFQFSNNIRPNIIDYDCGIKKLNIVDKEFMIWLSYQEKETLVKLIMYL